MRPIRNVVGAARKPARHLDSVDGGLRLQPVPAGAERRRQGARESASAGPLPVEVRQELLDAICSGRSFRTVLRDLGLTSNQVFGLAKTDDGWSAALENALAATRRADLKHGTTPAYVRGCVCSECGEHQRVRMAKQLQ